MISFSSSRLEKLSNWFLGLFIALLFCLMFGPVGFFISKLPFEKNSIYLAIAVQCFIGAIVIPIIMNSEIREMLGEISWKVKFEKEIWVSYFLLLVVLRVVIAVMNNNYAHSTEPVIRFYEEEIAKGRWFLVFLSICVIAPALEELVFRHAALSPALTLNKCLNFTAVISVSLFFAFAHTNYQQWTTTVSLILLGSVLGFARICSKGIFLPIALHATSNLYVLCNLGK